MCIRDSIISAALFQSCQQAPDTSSKISDEELANLKKIALQVASDNDSVAARLKTFDELDFDAVSYTHLDVYKRQLHGPANKAR